MPERGEILWRCPPPTDAAMGLEAAAARVMARIGIWVHSSGDAIEYKIGITAGPKFRWDQPDWGYGVEGYRFMDVLHTGSAKFVKRLEARLTDELMGVDWRCRNRARGAAACPIAPRNASIYMWWCGS